MVIKIGIIGYKNHAARLLSILEKKPGVIINFIYHPTKSLTDSRFTNNFSDLFNCDAIMIASPNHTHFEYIRKLLNNDFVGYIFCEKPPVTSLDDFNKLEKIPLEHKNKIFFNFNLRFSKLSEEIKKQINSQHIGKIIYINIISSKGLAFKKEYLGSWRADGEKNIHNILDTVSIHYIDMLNLHFGNIKKSTYIPSLISKNGTSYDTNQLLLQYDNSVIASIFNSYATPHINEILIIGTNGFLTIRNDKLQIYSPRDTFDSKGFFTNPPLFQNTDFVIEDDIENSLSNSIDFFLSCVKGRKTIDAVHFNTSLATTSLILQLEQNFL